MPASQKRCRDRCIAKKSCCKNADCGSRQSGKVCKRGRCVCGAGTKRCGKRCLPKAAACPPAPDASCRPGGGSVSGYAWVLRTAQTFTELNGGRLTAASLWIRNGSAATAGDYELRVNTVDASGAPTLETLAVARRSSDDVSDTALDWVTFRLPNPPTLKPGQRNALVLTMIGGTGVEGWVTEHRSNDPCPGGEFFVANPTGPFFLRAGTDTPFATFVTA